MRAGTQHARQVIRIAANGFRELALHALETIAHQLAQAPLPYVV
jgi:hypothetical protein